ncbi:MAG: hypothetical protein JWL91_2671 [Sphingomonas bacterium]|nr:hypothetical protein [Sphingomonas bacterium]
MVSRTRIQAALPVVAGISRFENAIDDTLIDGNQLMASLLRARQDARLAAEVGHEALEHIFVAYSGVFHARRSAVQGHQALEDLRKRLNLPEMGDGGKLPSDPMGQLMSEAVSVPA